MDNTTSNDPIFKNLSPLKKAVIAELMEKAANTPLDKAFPLLLKANATLNKQGDPFTPEERNMLITELTKKLSPEERKKIAALLKIKLAIKLITINPATILFSFAGGTKTAANIPYRATLKALTTLRGRIFPINTPKKVPIVQPGAAIEITP